VAPFLTHSVDSNGYIYCCRFQDYLQQGFINFYVESVKPRLHDTTGCQTGCITGLTNTI